MRTGSSLPSKWERTEKSRAKYGQDVLICNRMAGFILGEMGLREAPCGRQDSSWEFSIMRVQCLHYYKTKTPGYL